MAFRTFCIDFIYFYTTIYDGWRKLSTHFVGLPLDEDENKVEKFVKYEHLISIVKCDTLRRKRQRIFAGGSMGARALSMNRE